MGMIAAKCAFCGAPLEMDARAGGFCPYCGSKYLAEGGLAGAARPCGVHFERFLAFEKLGHTAEAAAVAEEMTKLFPQESISWACLARACAAEASDCLHRAEANFSGDKIMGDDGKLRSFPLSAKTIRANCGAPAQGRHSYDGQVCSIASDFYRAETRLFHADRAADSMNSLSGSAREEDKDFLEETRRICARVRERKNSLAAQIDRSAAAHRRTREVVLTVIAVAAIVIVLIAEYL